MGRVVALALTLTAGFGHAQAPATIQGRVISGAPESSLVLSARVDLLLGDSTVTSVQIRDGYFTLTLPDSVRHATPVLLRARAIGYHPRIDTLHLPASGRLSDYQIELTEARFCIDICPPDSAAVAAAWAQRATWSCAKDDAEQARADAAWFLRFLAYPDLRREARIRHPSRQDVARLRPETRDSVCRRLGLAVVRWRGEGTEATTFRVFRFGVLWLVRPSDEANGYVLSSALKVRTTWFDGP